MSQTVCACHLPSVSFPFVLQFYPKFIGVSGVSSPSLMDVCVRVSSIDTVCYIYGDFTIQDDVPGGNGKKFLSLVDLCNLKQLVA